MGGWGSQPQSPGSHLLRGDPASLGCGQRVSQAVARKTAGGPVPTGFVHGPAAPQCPPPPIPTPHRHPESAPGNPRESGPARGPRDPPDSSPALTPRQCWGSGALPGPGSIQVLAKSGQRYDWAPQSDRPKPQHLGPGPRAPSWGRPVGAPWGRATRPLPTRRPQTRPKFPRPPGRRAPTFRAPGF